MVGKSWIKPTSCVIYLKLVDIVSTSGMKTQDVDEDIDKNQNVELKENNDYTEDDKTTEELGKEDVECSQEDYMEEDEIPVPEVILEEISTIEEEPKVIVLDFLSYVSDDILYGNSPSDDAKMRIMASSNYCLLKKILPLCIEKNIHVQFTGGRLICLPMTMIDSSIVDFNGTELFFIEESKIYKKN